MLERSMTTKLNHATLSDPEVLARVCRLAAQERKATAELIDVLGELDARRLYLAEGCSSLFTYCTTMLHLSEHAAYGRIEAARAARKWPLVLEMLADGSIHLTAVTLLSRHFTNENHAHLLQAARHKSKREIEEIVASLRPQPPVPSVVRKLPAPKAAPKSVTSTDRDVAPTTRSCDSGDRDAPAAALRLAEIKPLAPERYKVQLTVSRETYDKLRQAQNLLRHQIANGDVAEIFDRALTLLLTDLEKKRHSAAERPRLATSRASRGRHIPAAVKREVWKRDEGQCAFVGAQGRCDERGFLEYHHVLPFAEAGRSTAQNIELRCRAHNAYEATRWFGVGEEDLVRESPAASYG